MKLSSFVVAPFGSVSRALLDSIRDLRNASAGFRTSWRANDFVSAVATSAEGFGYLDHVQHELLRHRDEKSTKAGWKESAFCLALSVKVGELLQPTSEDDKAQFASRGPGKGYMPEGATEPLSLNDALYKIKQRATSVVNFAVSSGDVHELFIFTPEDMGKSAAISKFDLEQFCGACKAAAKLL